MLTSILQKSIFKFVSVVLGLTILAGTSRAQSTCPPATPDSCGPYPPHSFPGVPVMKNYKVSGLNLAGGMFTGMLVYAPPGYDCNNSAKKYPVIIFFHGLGARGDQTGFELCRILSDQFGSLPGLIEQGLVPKASGTAYTDSFVVISPQYTSYNYPSNFATAQHVDPLLDYILANFQVNPNKVYLTGISSGANIVIEYAGSSLARAQRVAAINGASGCSQPGVVPNDTVAAAQNIGNATLPAWFIACNVDNSCGTPRPDQIYQIWYDSIRAIIPPPNPATPRFKILTSPGTDPLNNCQGFPHNTWAAMYDPAFQENGTNLYQWFHQFARNITVPVKLKEFSARLVNGKVHLRWVTTDEKNNSSFTLERAAADQRFAILATLSPNNTPANDRVYEFIDDKPFGNLSFYRLFQTDHDGRKNYFETRRVLNRLSKTKLITTPNPFANELSAFITIDKPQKILVYITDPNGRQVKKITGVYREGTSEIIFRTAELRPGIYFLKVEAEDFTETKRIIKH